MCAGNKHVELLEFVFNTDYVDLKYNESYLIFTAEFVCLCGVCRRPRYVCEVCLGTLCWCGRCGDCDM